MKRTALTITRSARLAAFGGATLLAALGSAAVATTPASAGEHHAYINDAVNRGGPAKLEQVRRRVIIEHDYVYDPYAAPAYYPPTVTYGPPVAYPPPVAYEAVPPVDYDYVAPGPGFAVVGPRGGVVVGY
ncbi:hypothetical protein [Methyloceanibacter sp.]|uniref:hypothetical protein n=1 Tax=Methyloceanibacter sp. TaxID=1965321 RepID=UPI002D7502F5|nr:hypothetical protein [Methyloceanibacter sp.]HZP10585.1 hypothetical protein [Methyloceanibacter sp.]